MDKEEIIRRLKRLAEHSVHVVGEPPLILSLDDGIALDEAVRLLKEQETTSTDESKLFFHCEKCGYGLYDIYLSNEYDFDVDPHYCPNCGRHVKRK